MFVFACNPCPCGKYHPSAALSNCECPEVRAATTDASSTVRSPTGSTSPASGAVDGQGSRDPVAPPPRPAPWSGPGSRQPASASGCATRRSVAHQRPGPGPVLPNAGHSRDPAARRLDTELYAGRLTRRGVTRVHRLAWTVADLQGVEPARESHELDVALRLRTGQPLLLSSAGEARGRMSRDEERLARVALCRLAEPGDPRLAALVDELGAVAGAPPPRRRTGRRRDAHRCGRPPGRAGTRGGAGLGREGRDPLRHPGRRRVADSARRPGPGPGGPGQGRGPARPVGAGATAAQ